MKIDMRQSPGSFLRKAVLANAIFSALSGLLIVLFEPTVLRWLGVDPIGIWPIGAMLLGFSLYLLWLAYGRNVPVSLVKGVIFGDWAWVAGSALLVLAKAATFSGFGIFLILDTALIVMVLALLQSRGLRKFLAQPLNQATH